MNKGILFGGLAAIIVIGGGIYFYSQPNTPASEPTGPGQVSDISDNSGENMAKNSIAALMLEGKPLECTFLIDDENANQTGIVYLANQRMRGEFSMRQGNGEEMNATVIHDGDYAYSWGDTPFGAIATKVKINQIDNSDSDDQVDTFDLDEELDLNCKSWNIDASMFVPPTNIEFEDLSASIQEINEVQKDLTDLKCSACDQVPAGPNRDQCRQALGC
jgi:hypothetical protein